MLMSNVFSPSESSAIIRALRERRTTGPLRFDAAAEPDHAVVAEAVESARWAPNHKRTEPWRFFLLDESRIAALADVNAERMRRAGSAEANIEAKHREWSSMPGVMIVLCQHAEEHDAILRKENYAACAAAAQNFQLHLFAEGIASKWSTAACWDVPGFWELLGFDGWPDLVEPVGIFSYGVPASVPPARRNLERSEILTDFRETVVPAAG